MQLKKFYQHQIEVDSLSSGNLSSIQPALRHLIDFITVQHQVGCESIMLVKKDVLVLNGQKLVQGMAMFEQRTLKDTIQVLTEIQPLVAEDAEMAALVQQTIPKMQQLNEQQFKGLELEWYKPEEPDKEKA